MKKFILLTLCFVTCSIAFAQIDVDKVEDDGSRLIVGEYYNLYTGLTNTASFKLSCNILVNGEETYNIILCLNEGKMQFNEGRKLLIKFKDGSVMELKNNKEIGPADYEIVQPLKSVHYITYPRYSVTEEEIQKIIDGEVVKVRIENNIDFIDRNIKKNKFSDGIKKSFAAIKAKKETQNDLYEGF
jgi:hypothetical protein